MVDWDSPISRNPNINQKGHVYLQHLGVFKKHQTCKFGFVSWTYHNKPLDILGYPIIRPTNISSEKKHRWSDLAHHPHFQKNPGWIPFVFLQGGRDSTPLSDFSGGKINPGESHLWHPRCDRWHYSRWGEGDGGLEVTTEEKEAFISWATG